MFSHVVPQKGTDAIQYAVDRQSRSIQWRHRMSVILKSDNKKAIPELLSEVPNTSRVLPVERASDSTRKFTVVATETMCKRVDVLRTMVLKLELDFGEMSSKIPNAEHPISSSVVEQVGLILIYKSEQRCLNFVFQTKTWKESCCFVPNHASR